MLVPIFTYQVIEQSITLSADPHLRNNIANFSTTPSLITLIVLGTDEFYVRKTIRFKFQSYSSRIQILGSEKNQRGIYESAICELLAPKLMCIKHPDFVLALNSKYGDKWRMMGPCYFDCKL